MEQIMKRRNKNVRKELQAAPEADIYGIPSGDEAEALFMVEEIEAV